MLAVFCRLPAAHQTGLLTTLQTALQPRLLTADPGLRLARLQPKTLRSQLLTLLFLAAVELQRTWDLRGYTGTALAILTGRRLAYGYRHTERFLAELARIGADEALTTALASWTATRLQTTTASGRRPCSCFLLRRTPQSRLH